MKRKERVPRGPSRGISRRSVLSSLAGGALTGCIPPLSAFAASPGAGDRPLGQNRGGILWGASIANPALYDSALRDAIAREKPKVLAIANGTKFGSIYPSEDSFVTGGKWWEADDVGRFAEALGAGVRADALVWNDWLPDWINKLAARDDSESRKWMARYFDGHIERVLTRSRDAGVPGGPRWVGVVNEPFNPWISDGDFSGYREGAWLTAFGRAADGTPNYIARAFATARRHRASAQVALFLNEAHCENDHFGPRMRPSMLKLIDTLQAAKVSPDALGLECHLMPQWMETPRKPDWSRFKAFLGDVAARGLKIYITELDVIDCIRTSEKDGDQLVSDYVSSLVEACMGVPGFEMVTVWDLSDKYSWLRDGQVFGALSKWAYCPMPVPKPRPDLYDDHLRAKPPREALSRVLDVTR